MKITGALVWLGRRCVQDKGTSLARLPLLMNSLPLFMLSHPYFLQAIEPEQMILFSFFSLFHYPFGPPTLSSESLQVYFSN